MPYKANTIHRPIKMSHYNRAIDGWFMALRDHDGNPKLIIKQEVLAKSGLMNQWFTHNFGTLDDFYSVLGEVFRFRLRKAIADYDRWIIKKRDIWEQIATAVYACSNECRIALIRGDFSFWMNALVELKPILSARVFKRGDAGNAYRYGYTLFVCLFSLIIADWNEAGFKKNSLKIIASRLESAGKCLSLLYPYLQAGFQD